MLGGGIGLTPRQAEATAILNVYVGTFRNNHAPGKWDNGFGGAIANFNGKSVHLENAIIEENSAQFGGAIYSGTPPEMKDCLFVNNTTAKGGDAIYATGSLIAEGIWPWLMAVFDVCWGLKDATNPGKRHFLAFARGKGTPLTLANNIFGALPGVVSWCSTLAYGFF